MLKKKTTRFLVNQWRAAYLQPHRYPSRRQATPTLWKAVAAGLDHELWCGEKRNDLFFSHLYMKMMECQDRLGTNRGKVEKRGACSAGAKGDGVTDDSEALQRAVNAHGEVFLPHGVYLLANTVTLGATTSLFGEGYSVIMAGGAEEEDRPALNCSLPFPSLLFPVQRRRRFAKISSGQPCKASKRSV